MNKTHLRGFASMSKERHREIASMGGKAAHASGKAYKWNSETAAEAGKKSGGINRSKTCDCELS
jgi:general stress protein YciG